MASASGSVELMGFIRNFNKYRAGNDEQVWTQIYNGYSLVVNRINSQPINIQDTFIGIIGTIQPGMLPEFAKGKKESGFLDRWQFSYPEVKHYPRLNISVNAPKIDYVKEEFFGEFRKMGFNYYRDKLEEFECFQRWYDLAEGNAEDLKELVVRAYDLLGVEVPPIVAEVAFFPRSMARLVW